MARILAAAVDSAGHAGLLVPLVEGAAAAGHEVTVLVGRVLGGQTLPDGVRRLPLPPPDEELAARIDAEFGRSIGMQQEGRLRDADLHVVGEVFGHLGTILALDTMREAVAIHRPDVVLHDPFHGASLAAAAAAGLPSMVIPWYPRAPLADFEDAVAVGAAQAPGAPPADTLHAQLDSARRVTPLTAAADPAPGVHRWRRRPPIRRAPTAADRPLVYATMGTIVGQIPPLAARFASTLFAAVADLAAEVVLTVGRQGHPAMLPPAPDNVAVEAFRDHDEVLARASVAVSHGGLNTVTDVVAAGVPQVVMPMHSADQAVTGAWVADAGAGVSLPGEALTPAAVRAGIDAALDGAFDDGAGRLAAAQAALPSPAVAIDGALAALA